MGILKEPAKADQNPWERSEYRSNQFVAVKLLRKQMGGGVPLPPIWIGNYHMPCAFREPAVMTLHCDLVAQQIQSLASKGNTGFVLAGDFNILPDSPQYQFMTTGKICSDGAEEADKNVISQHIPPER